MGIWLSVMYMGRVWAKLKWLALRGGFGVVVAEVLRMGRITCNRLSHLSSHVKPITHDPKHR